MSLLPCLQVEYKIAHFERISIVWIIILFPTAAGNNIIIMRCSEEVYSLTVLCTTRNAQSPSQIPYIKRPCNVLVKKIRG